MGVFYFLIINCLFMKRSLLTGGILFSGIIGLYAFNVVSQAAISGTVTPPEGATAVWAVNGSDSVAGTFSNGSFSISVKPGTYKLFIDAKAPYKDVSLENIQVSDTAATNVGEIKLEK